MKTLLGIRSVDRAEDIGAQTLLGLCTSLKPAPGRAGRSAARSLLIHALDLVADVYPEVSLLDLRDHPPPLFDGRMPEENDDPIVQLLASCIERAGALLISVPAYWSGVSGVFKNLVDVLCGPAYDMQGPTATVFSSKPVGFLVIGAETASAQAGAEQTRAILLATGARLVGNPVIVADPRRHRDDMSAVSNGLAALAGELAQNAYRAAVRREP
ncbi:MAG TPA: NAD(P)H-dependent oxidoreductase [Thermoanaerobaculia bacterium]|jgi:NAD(P)H-dependent FMN reductase